MTLKEWEKSLLRCLKGLQKNEKEKIIEYYREMYGDKVDAGYTGEEILTEFGNPEDCAKKILAENANEKVAPEKEKKVKVQKERRFTPANIIGMVFFTLLIFLPLASVGIGVIASFGAITVSGVATGVAGALYFLVAPIYFLANGVSFGGMLFHVGVGVAAVGIGILLFIGFYLLTKYAVGLSIKICKSIYWRRSK